MYSLIILCTNLCEYSIYEYTFLSEYFLKNTFLVICKIEQSGNEVILNCRTLAYETELPCPSNDVSFLQTKINMLPHDPQP